MPTIQGWLSEHAESHKNETNKAIHWICVPAIFFSIAGLLYAVKLPFTINTIPANAAMVVILAITCYYFYLSRTLWIGLLLFGCACLYGNYLIERYCAVPLWAVCVVIFLLAWGGQFYGHKVEGKKPSFFKDIQFLMIGPAWLMSFVYKKIGVGL